MNTLPNDLIRHIWSFVPCTGGTWRAIPMVCKLWYRLRMHKEPLERATKRAKLCPSRSCSAEKSVLRMLLYRDASMLNHVWHDDSIDLRGMASSSWFTEWLLSMSDTERIQDVLQSSLLPDTFCADELLRRACRAGRTDIISWLLDTRRVHISLHDFIEACRCLENQNISGPLMRLFCEPHVAELVKSTVLVDCLTSRHYHMVLRWLLHWEPDFASPETLYRLFHYGTTHDPDTPAFRKRGLVYDTVTQRTCPWERIKADYIITVAELGWPRILCTMLQHMPHLCDTPTNWPQHGTLLKQAMTRAAQHGRATCMHVCFRYVHQQGMHHYIDYAELFRRTLREAPKARVAETCHILLRTNQIPLDAPGDTHATRNNLWLCTISNKYWHVLDAMLCHPRATPFQTGHDLIRVLMSACPPRGQAVTFEARLRVAKIIHRLLQRVDFTATPDTLLRIILYARHVGYQPLIDTLFHSAHISRLLRHMICTPAHKKDTPSQHVLRKRRMSLEQNDTANNLEKMINVHKKPCV